MNFAVTVRRLPDRTMGVRERCYLKRPHAGLEVLECWDHNLRLHRHRHVQKVLEPQQKCADFQSPLLKHFKINGEATVGEGPSHRSIGHIATGSKEEAKDESRTLQRRL